jgi:hypothetical protein
VVVPSVMTKVATAIVTRRLLFSAVEILIAKRSSDTSRADTEISSDTAATETQRILRSKGAKERHKRT